jgi:hypothetical protein
MPMRCGVELRQEFGHGDARPLAPDNNFILACNNLDNVAQTEMRMFKHGRANPDGSAIAPLRDFTGAGYYGGHGVFPVYTVDIVYTA